MRAITSLFGKSPFSPLRKHMDKVSVCVHKVFDVWEAAIRGEWNRVEELAKEISRLEHLADLTKNEIRNHLPKSLFLPIERESLLSILSLQDDMADAAEDIGVLFTLKQVSLPEEIKKDFGIFIQKNIQCFDVACRIIHELQELLHSSFGGLEAESVKSMVDDVAYKEHESDVLQRDLLKKLFLMEKEFTFVSFHLWMRILEGIAAISDHSEKLANCISVILERR